MRLEALKNFITVVECGTITEAARKICIAQPALSNQIRGLEEELGVQLFHRPPRSMELTEAGRILYRHSRSICCIGNYRAAVRGEARPFGLGFPPPFPAHLRPAFYSGPVRIFRLPSLTCIPGALWT